MKSAKNQKVRDVAHPGQRRRIEIKGPEDLRKMRVAGKIVADVLKVLAANVRPGVTTLELDKIAAREIEKSGARPAFLGYCGYPAVICASINDEIVHGIPEAGRILREGDIVSIDVGAIYEGYYGDSAVTVPVGKISNEAQKLLFVTRESLEKAIDAVVPGATVGDISAAVESFVVANGMSVVKEFVGHGIGRKLHEEPPVPNFGQQGTGAKLEYGMTIAIEPMVCAGSAETTIRENGWTAVARDGSWSAHFEHTIAVTENGCEVLTS